MIDEGYIKFSCDWTAGPPPPEELIVELEASRRNLFKHGLIGHDRDADVDYGNISVRGRAPDEIIITGTQTGHLPTLSAEHFVTVTACDIEANRVRCEGAIKASSETLTHAAIYRQSGDINAVLHVHHQALWEYLYGRLPTTVPAAAYGTPAIAREFERLYREADLGVQKIAVMGGHPAGLISFGDTPAEAEQRLFKHLHSST